MRTIDFLKHTIVEEIVHLFSDAGYPVFIVGGCVRDMELGKLPKDVDFATNATYEQLIDVFGKDNIAYISENSALDVFKLKYKQSYFEIARFRKEEGVLDGRHPAEVQYVDEFELDTERRDFTINALGYDKEFNLIDYHGGLEDLENKIIRCVGDPRLRFQEDVLRIIRAIRFSARYNFTIQEDTGTAIREYAHLLSSLPVERITQEVLKSIEDGWSSFYKFILLLDEYDILKIVFEPIYDLKGMEHSKEWHPEGDAYEHTLACLRVANETNFKCTAGTALGILFHDCGKATTHDYKEISDGTFKHTYHGHDYQGTKIFAKYAKKFRLSSSLVDEISFCIEKHMQFHHFLKMRKGKVQKMVLSPYWESLKAVAYCDDASRGTVIFDEDAVKLYNDIIEYCKGLTEITEMTSSIIRGTEVIKHGIPKGPLIGKILRLANEIVLTTNVTDENTIKEIIKLICLSYK